MRLVITGTSSGIGRALTRHLLTRGHEVWGLARSAQDELLAERPGHFRYLRCDVAEWSQVAAAAEEISAHVPAIDGIVTCAALQGEVGRTLTSNPVHWTSTVHANLAGTYHILRAFFPLLERTGRRAKIVCFSGGGATKARPNFSAYGVAKTGIVRLVETIAEEERNTPLDINAIAPGAINTRLTDEIISLGPEKVGTVEHQNAIKQKLSGGSSVEKAVALVEWLLSPESDGISGRLISAPWDPWPALAQNATTLRSTDIYTLRRIVPEERGQQWDTPSPKA